MRISGLDKNGDWTFGFGRANYIRDAKAIEQNVSTRLKSFVDDWIFDIQHGIDWLALLSTRGTERRIIRAIERSVMQTEGVLSIQKIEITQRDQHRGITIELVYTNVFSQTVTGSETVIL